MRYNTAYAAYGISGDPTPSEADIKVTRDLIRAGQLLKIDVLDHVIIGRATPERQKDYASLRELGCFAQLRVMPSCWGDSSKTLRNHPFFISSTRHYRDVIPHGSHPK